MSPALPVILRGGGVLRDPRRLPGMAAWFDGMDPSTLTVDGSNRVSNWADKSGLGSRDLAQGTVIRQPTYDFASRTLTFDGVLHFLKTAAFTLNQPTTIYFIGSQISWVVGGTFFDGNATDTHLQQDGVTPNWRIFAGASLAGSGPPLGSRALVSVVFNGASSSLRKNRDVATTGAAGAANMGGLTVGSAYPGVSGKGNITANEVAIYNAAHTAAQQNRFAVYAMRKWGIR